MASAIKVLLSQTGATGVGPITSFQSTDNIRMFQFVPQINVGYSGAVLIEHSYAANPGNNDFQTMVSLTFTGATANFSLEVEATAPWVRARVVKATSGALAISGSSKNGTINGSQGNFPANVIIDSAFDCAGSGSGFAINSPVVPSITSDNVFMATNLSQTVTQAITAKQNVIGSGNITASEADLNLLAGRQAAGLEVADFTKLAAITASASDINQLSGLSTTATELGKLAGFTGNAADLNAIAGLGGTTVDTTELSYLSGLTTNVQIALNNVPALGGLTSTVVDLNLLSGASAGTGAYSGKTLSTTVLGYLSGVSSNIQTQLNAKRNSGDTIGISEITGSNVNITQFNYLNGVTSSIQSQLNALAFSGTYGPGQFSGVVKFANGTVSLPGTGFAGAATTGFFLNGAALGVAIGGAQAMNVTGTSITIGDNVSSGAPSLRGSGYGSANPAYTFVGDLTTGMYWVSAGKIGISGSGRSLMTVDGSTTPGVITLGTTADNTVVNIAGKFSGERVLAKVDVNAGKSPASPVGSGNETDLYTVPTGRTLVVTRIAVILKTATQGGSGAATNQFRMDLGNKAGTCKELLDNVTNTTVFNPGGSYSFNTAGQVFWLGQGDNDFKAVSGANGNAYAQFSAGTVISARPQARADFDVWTVSLVVFGYEF